MPTNTNAKTQNLNYLGHLLWEYSFYLRQELRNPTVYLSSLSIALLVTWLMQTPSMIPFLASWIVLVAANAILKFRNSDIETLLLLPAHWEDPAFIMDLDGQVILSAGKTDRLFQKESINNIKDIIGVDGFDRIIHTLDPSCTDPETRSIDIYSERLQNWYKIKFKPIVSRCGSLPEKLLVWFSEVTAQREAQMRQHDLLNYTGSLMSNVQTRAREKSTYDHLADRCDALRSRRPYKEAYSHEKTLAVMTDDNRSGIRGYDWYGEAIWGVFEKHHLRLKEVFEHMRN